MESVVERLARSPKLGLIYRDLADLWEQEQKARQRFYESVEDGQKVEFINGEIIVHSPDTLKHVQVRKRLTKLLDTHAAVHDLGLVGDEKLLVALTRNDYMPDVVFFLKEKAAALEGDQSRFPAPDFAAEVLSSGTRRRDRGLKFEDYAAHGVREYWILDPDARTVEQYLLNALGRYALQKKASGDDEVRSEVVTGFKAPANAFFNDRANLAALRKLLR
ncbi:MAG: Uma2 family endonuclease [Verrucomicrobia bacterium]|nr:Uma2 family endonuclease [Verrucomicrobiota bacterium]